MHIKSHKLKLPNSNLLMRGIFMLPSVQLSQQDAEALACASPIQNQWGLHIPITYSTSFSSHTTGEEKEGKASDTTK